MIPKFQMVEGKRYQGFLRAGKSQDFALGTWQNDQFVLVEIWSTHERTKPAPHSEDGAHRYFEPISGVGDWSRRVPKVRK